MLDVAKMAHESWTAGAADAGRVVIGSQGLVASGECHCRSRRQMGFLGRFVAVFTAWKQRNCRRMLIGHSFH